MWSSWPGVSFHSNDTQGRNLVTDSLGGGRIRPWVLRMKSMEHMLDLEDRFELVLFIPTYIHLTQPQINSFYFPLFYTLHKKCSIYKMY